MRDVEPRKQPRQVRAELTRQRILAAAAHVFVEHGYAAGTTNRIAERARVSIGSLYQYFPNKGAILAGLLAQHLDAGVATYHANQQPERLADIVRLFVRTAIDNHRDDPRLLRMLIEQAPWSPGLVSRLEGYQRERVAEVRALLESHPEVRVADTGTAAQMIVATVEVVVHQLAAGTNPLDESRLEDEMVRMLTAYLTSTP
ncbi:TetR/AcrR family transcriptional regulator [Actinoplanes sp. NPDC051470]|uniref:TetR/AcrR family transcriptional regulator n=1 Tax=unclassified Actinoplanes TaxID=2626549 RepID=UPI0034480454